jgi:3'(2'), 5'-bisphosphate nucleotidase
MTETSSDALLGQLTRISREAGDAILAIYSGAIEVTVKDDDSPLTQADLASHRIIRDALRELTPEWPLLSEESVDIPASVRRSWGTYWLVDPLDGTKEFINRNGEFTVNIALIRDHRPVLGVVHVPVSNVTYTGDVAEGAYRRDGDHAAQRISVRTPPASPLTIVGSRSHANPELATRLQSYGRHQLVGMGSSLKFCLVAEGQADLYPRIGPTSEWDTAAAQAVVEAAGGQVLKLDGEPLRYNTKDSFLNPYFVVCGDPTHDWLTPLQDFC